MTRDELEDIFEADTESDASEFLEFDRIEQKLSNRPDLHAFMLLDKAGTWDRS